MMAFWSAEETARLGEMAHTGASMGEIAKALGRTRSAVAGRLRRMDWHAGRALAEGDRLRRAPLRQCEASKRRRAAPEDRPIAMSVSFDPETYAEILERAKADGLSRAQIVRELVEWGLEA